MNIGIYISPGHTVPPNETSILAPWILTGKLSDALVDRGHNVTLFAAKESKTKAKLVSGNIECTAPRESEFSDREQYRSYLLAMKLALMREAVIVAKKEKIDILHIHQPLEELYPTLLALPQKLPIVLTFHDPITPNRFPALEKIHALGNTHFISLSKAQQKDVPLPFTAIVPNGIDLELFTPSDIEKKERPLLMTGRIIPDKGFTDGIAATIATGERLMIVGQEYSHQSDLLNYFKREVEPKIDGKTIVREGFVKRDHLIGHYQTAKALLFPIHWEEPFGLVMIEAMACGTPVIAYNRGSVSDIVVDGKTGFVVDEKKGIDGLIDAINKIDSIDRRACRKHVEKNFSIKKMIDGYENVYKKLV